MERIENLLAAFENRHPNIYDLLHRMSLPTLGLACMLMIIVLNILIHGTLLRK